MTIMFFLVGMVAGYLGWQLAVAFLQRRRQRRMAADVRWDSWRDRVQARARQFFDESDPWLDAHLEELRLLFRDGYSPDEALVKLGQGGAFPVRGGRSDRAGLAKEAR